MPADVGHLPVEQRQQAAAAAHAQAAGGAGKPNARCPCPNCRPGGSYAANVAKVPERKPTPSFNVKAVGKPLMAAVKPGAEPAKPKVCGRSRGGGGGAARLGPVPAPAL